MDVTIPFTTGHLIYKEVAASNTNIKELKEIQEFG
jgi:hypothetical protein